MDSVEEPVRAILARWPGDEALKEHTKAFDGVELTSLGGGPRVVDEGFRSADLVGILYQAAERIAAFHQHQVTTAFWSMRRTASSWGRRSSPLARVGLYVPRHRRYPSNVLMNCIPRQAGRGKRICMVTPPRKMGRFPQYPGGGPDLRGGPGVFGWGGAQAVAALAYGTESIPKVDKIVGPGNQFVAEAKKQVFGQVGIDMVAGPSEILVIADGKCRPEIVAADLLSQAEHDPNASAVLVTDSAALAEAVQAAVEEQLPKLLRKDITRASIDRNGKIIVAQSLDAAVEIANEIAPEHLELCVEQPFDYLDKIQNAGSVFLGRNCPEALGDYFAGPNHTLPTSGTARFSSPLSVDDFVKRRCSIPTIPRGPWRRPRCPVSNFARRRASPATPAAWTSGLTPPLPRRPHEPIFAHQVRGPGAIHPESSPGTSSTSNSTPMSPPIPPPRRFWRPWARGRWRTCGSTPTQRGPGCGRSWRGCTA